MPALKNIGKNSHGMTHLPSKKKSKDEDGGMLHTLPETNSSPLKMVGWFPIGISFSGGGGTIFRCENVSFREGIKRKNAYEPGSKLLVLGMVIQPLIGNPYNWYINPIIGLMTIPYYMEIM